MSEVTSETVASKAGWILGKGKTQLAAAIADAEAHGISGNALYIIRQYQQYAESCAGSALTQKEQTTARERFERNMNAAVGPIKA